LSKVFKSYQCVEATPCRLEPIDTDAFFINQLNEVENNQETEEIPEEEPEVVSLEQIREEADEIIDQARAEAQRIIAAAKQEAETIKAKAQTVGEAEGRNSGLENIRRELAGDLAEAARLLAVAEEDRQIRILSSEPELLALAAGIAEKILHAELKLNPHSQLELVKAALSKVPEANHYTVRMNPADLEGLTIELIPEMQSVFGEPKLIRIEAEPAVARGGCFIETDHGNIDARIRTQMELIMKELYKVGQYS
jgi:flagellar assembly protein FliH